MTLDIKSILNNRLPVEDSGKGSVKPPIAAVDRIADSLVAEFHNPDYRRWYCGAIYEFGPSQILEWQHRAREGKEPAKLFAYYVKQARQYKPRPEFNSE